MNYIIQLYQKAYNRFKDQFPHEEPFISIRCYRRTHSITHESKEFREWCINRHSNYESSDIFKGKQILDVSTTKDQIITAKIVDQDVEMKYDKVITQKWVKEGPNVKTHTTQLVNTLPSGKVLQVNEKMKINLPEFMRVSIQVDIDEPKTDYFLNYKQEVASINIEAQQMIVPVGQSLMSHTKFQEIKTDLNEVIDRNLNTFTSTLLKDKMDLLEKYNICLNERDEIIKERDELKKEKIELKRDNLELKKQLGEKNSLLDNVNDEKLKIKEETKKRVKTILKNVLLVKSKMNENDIKDQLVKLKAKVQDLTDELINRNKLDFSSLIKKIDDSNLNKVGTDAYKEKYINIQQKLNTLKTAVMPLLEKHESLLRLNDNIAKEGFILSLIKVIQYYDKDYQYDDD